ncbi:MAG TPA: MFS transporter [Cyclobacteriaceae bacterium]|nr:MFS transporter [Cyclobacteriaceae bacterium]
MEALSLLRDREASLIRWKQLWSLAALYASVIIGWIAYYRYQPKLLVQYNFTQFSFLLVVAQALIMVITPPIAGRLGDRYRFTQGHRIPILSAGMSFTAMIFMAVAFTLIGNPGEVLRWIFPVLIILWLVGMSIFTSPALSTVELFAPIERMPYAMAILTIVSNVVYALEPIIVDIIDLLGAPATFSVGGIAVFLSGYALKKNSIDLFKTKEANVLPKENSKQSRFGLIASLGLGFGFASTMLFNVFPGKLQTNIGQLLGSADGNALVSIILLLSAAISLPMSNVVSKFGIRRSYWWSLAVVIISVVVIVFVKDSATSLFTLIFIVGFTAMSVSALPLVLNESSFEEKVFCVGVFYSAVALPDGVVEIMMAYLPTIGF